MPELIDKIEALGKLQCMYTQIEYACGDGNPVAKGVRKAYNTIKRMPTIEQEVRHGRWIQSDALDYKDPNGVIHVHGMCSCCRLIYDFRDMTSRFKFCPGCGARMDGGADNGKV